MFGALRKLLFSGRFSPPELALARRERRLGDAGWFDAKSWFGGAPKLGDEPWPRDDQGRPLHFLAQLDLEEIALAGGGRTALPRQGAFAFFVGFVRKNRLGGRIVYAKSPGLSSSPIPADLGEVEEIGGDRFVARTQRFAPSGFPFWPVEFRALVHENDVQPGADFEAQRAAIRKIYPQREYDFSARHEAKQMGLEEPPLPWLAALILIERAAKMTDQVAQSRALGRKWIENAQLTLQALDAGGPAPAGEPPFGDREKARKDAEFWLKTGQERVAQADAQEPSVRDFVARLKRTEVAEDPFQMMRPEEAARFDALFAEARSQDFETFSNFILPRLWRDYATDAVKLMAAGSNEAFARLPQVWRDVLNARYRTPIQIPHLMFGHGADIQGHDALMGSNMRMVLQLASDDMMYWPFGDNGVYKFWMPSGALRSGDVAKAQVTFEAH